MKETCLYCHKKVPEGFEVCPNCKTPVGDDKPYNPGERIKRKPLPPKDKPAPPAPLVCPKCGGNQIFSQVINNVDVKQRGCFEWVFWIFLAICTCGILLLIYPLATNTKANSTPQTVSTCQTCGHSWTLSK